MCRKAATVVVISSRSNPSLFKRHPGRRYSNDILVMADRGFPWPYFLHVISEIAVHKYLGGTENSRDTRA
jgi:hypothetical protein